MLTYNEDKEVTRANNLAHAMRNPILFAEGKLKVDWLELAGKGAPSYVEVVRPCCVPEQAVFIGADRDEEILQELVANHPEKTCRWQFVADLLDELEDRPDQYGRVGVLNFDTFNSVRRQAFASEVDVLARFAINQFWRLGGFCLSLTMTFGPSIST